MCYSTQVRHAYNLFMRMFDATMSIKEFNDLFFRRLDEAEAKPKIPKAMERAFLHQETDGEKEVAAAMRPKWSGLGTSERATIGAAETSSREGWGRSSVLTPTAAANW